MIYTVGRKDIYEPIIANNFEAAKSEGGSVWESFKDAQNYLGEGLNVFDIYGVEADWDKDTIPVFGKSWRALKIDAKLIKL